MLPLLWWHTEAALGVERRQKDSKARGNLLDPRSKARAMP
jgi:hypothetical protein